VDLPHFNEINIIQKFCDNRVDLDLFIKLMSVAYGDDKSYIEGKWILFKNNPIQFITSRAEKDLYNGICHIIKETDYKA